jgi:protein O-mannosyl-transferase
MSWKSMIKLTGRNITFLQVVLMIILGTLIYSNCFNGGFIWDDHGLIKDNEYIKNWSNLPKVITADFGFGSGTKSNFYRPLQTIIHMAGYSLWGTRTTGYHLISIIAHILAAIIFYFLLRNIFYDQTVSFLASLLFLSSPINTEAVCYISGLSDPLGLIFMLTCLLLYIKSLSLKNTKLYILALLSFTLALLSKENTMVLPLLILLYHYAFEKKLQVQKFLPFFGILSGYILLRLAILSPLDYSTLAPFTLWERIPIVFAGIAEYLRLLMLPLNLHMEYANQAFRFADLKVVLGLILTCLLISFAFMRRKANPGFFFTVAWFFITFLPVSNIYPISYAFIMEHYLYVPALGFFIILAGLFHQLLKIKIFTIFARFFIISLVIVYSYLTVKQTEYWKRPVAFYKRTLYYAPHSWRFYNELGIEYSGVGNTLEAEVAYKEALRINPDALGVYYNLMNLYKQTNDQGALLATQQIVQALRTQSVKRYYKEASLFKANGEYPQALAAFKKALEFDQDNLIVCCDLASTYVLAGKYKDAVILFIQVLKIRPDFALAYNNLAVAYYYLKQYDLAVKNCDKAITLGYSVESQFMSLLKLRKKM